MRAGPTVSVPSRQPASEVAGRPDQLLVRPGAARREQGRRTGKLDGEPGEEEDRVGSETSGWPTSRTARRVASASLPSPTRTLSTSEYSGSRTTTTTTTTTGRIDLRRGVNQHTEVFCTRQLQPAACWVARRKPRTASVTSRKRASAFSREPGSMFACQTSTRLICFPPTDASAHRDGGAKSFDAHSALSAEHRLVLRQCRPSGPETSVILRVRRSGISRTTCSERRRWT